METHIISLSCHFKLTLLSYFVSIFLVIAVWLMLHGLQQLFSCTQEFAYCNYLLVLELIVFIYF